MRVYSFPKGGIVFNDAFAPGKQESVLSFLPGISIIVLRSFSGNSSYPVVQNGSRVEEGMLIARRQGCGSANIHSPIPGRVIRTFTWKLAENTFSSAIAIQLEGKFERLGRIETERQWQELSQFQLRSILDKNGLVEMEGEGKPLCDRFTSYDTVYNEFSLALRCVFDDPWLAADYCICKERTKEVALGCVITAKAAGAKDICIAVSKNDEDIAQAIYSEIEAIGFTAVITILSSKYPQHSNKQIEDSLGIKEELYKTGGRPLMIIGPQTASAVYDAVVFNKPVTDRYVAVGGNAVQTPRVLKVRIGSRIGDVFKECGGFIKEPDSLVMGSPLMGRNAASLNEPILKCSGVVYASYDSRSTKIIKKIKSKLNLDTYGHTKCIGCGECRRVCPASLDPEELYKRKRNNKHQDTIIPLLMKCNGCGCCESVCPSRLLLCTAIVRPVFATYSTLDDFDKNWENNHDLGESNYAF
ncbi:MAG: electron transport complex subunit RsxC [Termitinemataceae bacterium]|nr:MAG: electron transport complex subunit RsxC [Termitinemataceae bacterium]